MKSLSPIKTYIEEFNPEIKTRLNLIYKIIKLHLPDAIETFAYQMPTLKGKKNLIHFAGYTNHIGIYPGPKGISFLLSIMPNAVTSKGAWRIPYTSPIPEQVLIKLCQWIQSQQ